MEKVSKAIINKKSCKEKEYFNAVSGAIQIEFAILYVLVYHTNINEEKRR